MLQVKGAAIHVFSMLEPKILGSTCNIAATTNKYLDIINKLTA